MKNTDVEQLIEQLTNKASANRRSAAKKLRKLKPQEAGPALYKALKYELKNKSTWETQYQIIMALGEVEYVECLEFLIKLAEQKFELKMVYVAIGDAITRLTYTKTGSIHKILKYIDNSISEPHLIDGLFRAIAMLKLVPNEKDINKIIKYGNSYETNENNRTWIASAAAGWATKNTENFLKQCLTSENQQTVKAAEAALIKKYIKWSIL